MMLGSPDEVFDNSTDRQHPLVVFKEGNAATLFSVQVFLCILFSAELDMLDFLWKFHLCNRSKMGFRAQTKTDELDFIEIEKRKF